ncbi:YceI family protein [Trinickia caryophylli]|uniref:Polyisoprenoid-binding protein YceI n=1 Tax=Trinickia caryophylli TaxID=28094 RepID=A0A1X7H9C2_TRICW|nr:YceI family protein [Trinickia caryophylli]PMS08997.1 YceI family protein [Trinickia caryophylli]TRX15036.1 YceI family protein [Trinickia caryophylli]WQE14895.1 YceI family protein [Trinickia caryophylli]SMF82080.1 Polyisoprenoid-binding protein YceI [Trinickia caryophylli]GLU35793.1 polyisoprenoid-binding protein [Trinickia caryophylli]
MNERMRRALIALFFALQLSTAQGRAAPVHYVLEPHRSSVVFVLHMLGNAQLHMHFRNVGAELDQAPETGEMPRVAVTIDARSVAASTPFTAHIAKGRALLDTQHYPEIRFSSTRFVRTGLDSGLLTGDLTIRAETKPVTLAVTFEHPIRAEGERATSLAVSARGHFSRAAFGLVGWAGTVGDDVEMTIRARFVQMAPGQ